MKKIIFSFLISFFLFSNVIIAQKVIVKNKYKIVKVKPNTPKNVIVKPKKVRRNYVWINGHWKWSFRMGRYVWVKGKWKRKKRYHQWVPGNWKKVSEGYIWIEGYWKK